MVSVLTEKDKEERKKRREKDWGLSLRYAGGKEQEAASLKKITVEGHRNILYGEREQAPDRIGVERWLSYPRTSPDTKTGLADTSVRNLKGCV